MRRTILACQRSTLLGGRADARGALRPKIFPGDCRHASCSSKHAEVVQARCVDVIEQGNVVELTIDEALDHCALRRVVEMHHVGIQGVLDALPLQEVGHVYGVLPDGEIGNFRGMQGGAYEYLLKIEFVVTTATRIDLIAAFAVEDVVAVSSDERKSGLFARVEVVAVVRADDPFDADKRIRVHCRTGRGVGGDGAVRADIEAHVPGDVGKVGRVITRSAIDGLTA
jgi:hypothetical protein